jgi:hypothetical protein
MAKSKKDTATSPALPPLSLAHGFWNGSIILKSWMGFQSRRGPYGAKDSAKSSDGTTALAISPTGEGDPPPSPEQLAAYRHLIQQQVPIRDSILAAVLAAYPTFRARFFEMTREPGITFPDANKPNDLKKVMGLTSVLIHPVSHGGLAYVGYEFGCLWDAEHGLGAMMYQDRVVDLGGADIAILEWIAERDAKRLRSKKR